MDIGSVLGVQTNSDGSMTGLGSGTLGKDEFLNLMIKQLQMQDPFEPMNNDQMIAQLAQFSQLEQLSNMNGSLSDNLQMDIVLGQLLNNTMATTLIGRQVTVATDSFHLSADSDVDLGYRLEGGASDVSLSIYDSGGRLVREIDGLDGEEGDHTFSWDGKDANGNRLTAGAYTFGVSASAGDDTVIGARTTLARLVEGVRYVDGNARLVLGDDEVLMSSVLEVSQSE